METQSSFYIVVSEPKKLFPSYWCPSIINRGRATLVVDWHEFASMNETLPYCIEICLSYTRIGNGTPLPPPVILGCFVNLTGSVSSLAHDAVVLFLFAYLVDVVLLFCITVVFFPSSSAEVQSGMAWRGMFFFLGEWSVLLKLSFPFT